MKKLGDLSDGNREILERIDYVKEHGVDNTDWEEDFLASIRDWVLRDRTLTLAQMDTLEKIEYKCEWGQEEFWKEYGDSE